MAAKKDKRKGRGKKDEAEAAAPEAAPEAITLRAYPHAMASIRRIRARAALVAFALVLLLSLHSGVLLPEAAARALAAGVAVHLASWKLAVLAWRQIVLGQVSAVEDRRRERAEAADRAADRAAEARAQAAEAVAAAQAG